MLLRPDHFHYFARDDDGSIALESRFRAFRRRHPISKRPFLRRDEDKPATQTRLDGTEFLAVTIQRRHLGGTAVETDREFLVCSNRDDIQNTAVAFMRDQRPGTRQPCEGGKMPSAVGIQIGGRIDVVDPVPGIKKTFGR